MQDISLEEATGLLLAHAPEPAHAEHVPLLQALGRVLAEDLAARFDTPPFDRSPLDGYALVAADTAGATRERPARLRIVGEAWAGQVFAGEVQPGEAVRILTGAAMPKGTDAVIRQEDVREEGDAVLVPYGLRRHENYCLAGEDIRAGSPLAKKGQTLEAAHLAVLASQGVAAPPVWRKPRIALASTGDELAVPGEALRPGKIYDSSYYLLAARLQELGAETLPLGILPDDPERAARALRASAEAGADLLLTTGGVSVGKRDILHETVRLLGARRLFWRIRMKPGAPAMGYVLGRTLGIALSGNPFASYAAFELLARPVIARLAGLAQERLPRCRVTLLDGFGKESRERRVVRAHVENGRASLPGQHAPGALFSAVGCNAFLDIPAGTGKLSPGDWADAILL